MDELRAICGIYGVFERREAKALGYHDPAIAALVRSGAWVRVRRGSYTFGDIWSSLDDAERYALLTRAVLRRSRSDAVLSHVSALVEHGVPLWNLDLSEVHLTRRDGRAGRHEAGVRQHQGALLDEDVVEINGVPVTSATRAGIELTTVATPEACVCVLDALVRLKLTGREQLAARYDSMQQWPGTLATPMILGRVDGRSESVGESRFRHLCQVRGLPMPELQREVADADGRVVARLDFAWPELSVFGEFDGRVKYGRLRREGESIEDAVLREKSREDHVRELTGWRCIRITWADLARPEVLVARLRAILFPATTAA